jgi:hypothetical protein
MIWNLLPSWMPRVGEVSPRSGARHRSETGGEVCAALWRRHWHDAADKVQTVVETPAYPSPLDLPVFSALTSMLAAGRRCRKAALKLAPGLTEESLSEMQRTVDSAYAPV